MKPNAPSSGCQPDNFQRKLRRSLPVLGLLLLVAALVGGVGGVFLGAAFPNKPSATATATESAGAATGARSSATATPATTTAATPLMPTESAAATAVPNTPDPQMPLAGRRIGIDPGHGPREDLGAVYLDPDTRQVLLSEADFNLDVALRSRDLLVARGAAVVLTRETADTFTTEWPNDANGDGIVGASGDDLQTRVDILNDFGAEVFLSIHANSSREPGNGDDLQMLYCGASDCPFSAESKRLGKLMLTHLGARLAETGYTINGGSLVDDLTIDATGLHMFVLGPAAPPRHIRATNMPGVIGETLYVTLPSEARLLASDGVRRAIALGYADALQEFLLAGGQ